MIINSPRLRLRTWQVTDRDAFAGMQGHPEVMHDYGGILSRSESYDKLDRYIVTYEQHGYCRWAIENLDGLFLG
ncbi:hypothetical protein A9Q96_00550 [Rhodobacterales bacterium 52_120_T64]|nr:hypothetical protein A9Q96_00550 [Rhodobacterales bacterium 52_120_T64]